MNICVYCGAKSGNDPEIYNVMTELGRQIASHGFGLIYGAGNCGLMGAVSGGVIESGGTVIGVAPQFMKDYEPVRMDDALLISVPTMGVRKEIMENNTDAFIVAPGGIGTFDEFFQGVTLKELGQLDCPVVLYNYHGYYEGLLAFIRQCVDRGFIRERVFGMFDVFDGDPKDLMDMVAERLAGKEV